MEEMSSSLAALRGALYTLPFLLLWIGGVVMAVTQRHRHPRISLISGIACGLMLLTELLTTGAIALINVLEIWSLMGTPMAIVSLFSNLVFALGLALLVGATWSGRVTDG